MSNRSAKLLLEVAKHFELRDSGQNLGGADVHVNNRLIGEVCQWAKGYEDQQKRQRENEKIMPGTRNLKLLAKVASCVVSASNPETARIADDNCVEGDTLSGAFVVKFPKEIADELRNWHWETGVQMEAAERELLRTFMRRLSAANTKHNGNYLVTFSGGLVKSVIPMDLERHVNEQEIQKAAEEFVGGVLKEEQ